MMRRIRGLGGLGLEVLAVSVLLSAGAGGTAAQDLDFQRPLGVEECVTIALERSDALGQAQGSVQSARGAYWGSYRGVLPSVDVSAGWDRAYVDYLGLAGVEYDGQVRLNVSQEIFSLPAIASLRAGGTRLEAARQDLASAYDDVALGVRQQFYQYVASLKVAEVEERAVALAAEQLRRSETLFRLGSVARSDVLQAQVNQAAAEQTVILTRNAVVVELARLALLMGLDPRTPLQVDSALVVPEADAPGDLDTWVARAQERRPDLAAARARLAAAAIAEGGARAERYPRIGAAGSWSRSARDSKSWLNSSEARYNNSWSLSLGVSMDIFTGLSTEGAIESAKGEKRMRQEALERLEKDAALEVQTAFQAIREARESLRAARTSVSLAQENLRLQQALYESGAGTLLEWDTARLDLRRAQLSLIQAQVSLLSARAAFRQAVGGGEGV